MTPSLTSPVQEKSGRSVLSRAWHVKADGPASTAKRSALRPSQATAAVAVFLSWLALFAAGITVDTRPSRIAISPSAVAALERTAAPAAGASADSARGLPPPANQPQERASGWGLVTAWFVVLTCFLPLNLAWICAASSLLGSFGDRANLADDSGLRRRHDNTNPDVSAILRGFFVYLFMTSGLLLLDDTPFSNATPAQYIRLAGFLSLFSFVVSYQPRLFNQLIAWAFQRIQMREGGEQGEQGSISFHQTRTTSEEVSVSGQARADTPAAAHILPVAPPSDSHHERDSP
jgi:hypothetical protein